MLIACSKHADISGLAPVVSFRTINNEMPIALHTIDKPILVNFWSTSCVICLKEMPHFIETYKNYAPKGFEMVAVAMPFDRPSDVVELASEKQWPFLVAIDLDGSVSKAFDDVAVTPTSFLIDANGEFVEKYVGAVDISKLEKRLDKLLSKS